MATVINVTLPPHPIPVYQHQNQMYHWCTELTRLYLKSDVMSGLAYPLLRLQAVLPSQWHSGPVQPPVFLPLELQDEYLRGQRTVSVGPVGQCVNTSY